MKNIIKRFFASVLIATTANVIAADNSIYVDQSGSNSTISMTQDGYGNTIRGIQSQGGNDNTVAAKIYGNTNSVTVNQVGMNNTLNLGVAAPHQEQQHFLTEQPLPFLL